MGSSCFFHFSLTTLRNQRLQTLFQSSGLHSTIKEVDPGTLLHCWIPQDASSRGKGNEKPALMLIQGFATNSMWHWSGQVRPLSTHFRLYIPDLIFWGKSTTNTTNRSEVFQAQMMVKLMETLGVPKFSVVGTSYGGFVAFWMAHHFPNAVTKVVIANSGVCINPEDSVGLLDRAKLERVSDLLVPQSPPALRTLMHLSLHKAPKFLPTFFLNDFLSFFYTEHRTERVQLLDGLVIGTRDAPPLPVLNQKVLIIWGDHDAIFLPELGDRLKVHLGDRASLEVVKGCGHCVQLENPSEFNRIVLRFLLEPR